MTLSHISPLSRSRISSRASYPPSTFLSPRPNRPHLKLQDARLRAHRLSINLVLLTTSSQPPTSGSLDLFSATGSRQQHSHGLWTHRSLPFLPHLPSALPFRPINTSSPFKRKYKFLRYTPTTSNNIPPIDNVQLRRTHRTLSPTPSSFLVMSLRCCNLTACKGMEYGSVLELTKEA